MKTLIYSTHNFEKFFLETASEIKHDLVFIEETLSVENVDKAKGFNAVSLFTSDNASAEVLKLLSDQGIRFIALRSVGHDHVDLKSANQLGIKVANVPSYSPYAIAEHSVALLLALNRKLLKGQQLMSQNDFRLDKLIGFDLHGKTIGVIGTGKIGSAFANIMNGFGCNLLAYDINENRDLIDRINISYTSLEELCKISDVISIHCPLNESTKMMFNSRLFKIMKRGIIIINTARGAIINTVDLLKAIDDGIVSAAGLDVYANEKPIFFHDLSGTKIKDELFERLRSYTNVLITGHQAFLTNEALKGIADTTIDNLSAWEKNGVSENDLT